MASFDDVAPFVATIDDEDEDEEADADPVDGDDDIPTSANGISEPIHFRLVDVEKKLDSADVLPIGTIRRIVIIMKMILNVFNDKNKEYLGRN